MKKRIRMAIIIILAAALLATGAYFLWPSVTPVLTAQATPKQVVEAYYDWYLGTIGKSGDGEFRNPLVDRAYRDSKLLSSSFVGNIDDLLSSDQLAVDPFLCAQDIPTEISIQGVFINDGGARVVVQTDFPGHVFTVNTQESKGRWKITNVTCGGTPEGMTNAFYTWYLGYIDDRAPGEFNNPLTDRAYRESQFLSPDFIASVDEMLAKETLGGFDPFLLAQDIPSDFSVDPGLTEDRAVVHLQFGESMIRHIRLLFTRENGQLLISSIEEDIR
jgi:hypothetical protein